MTNKCVEIIVSATRKVRDIKMLLCLWISEGKSLIWEVTTMDARKSDSSALYQKYPFLTNLVQIIKSVSLR